MLLLDFCNIKEWSREAVLDLYKKHRIIHSKWGARDGFEKFCVSKYHPKSPLAFALVEASEIAPWLSEDAKIVSPSQWLGRPIIFPSNGDYSEIWRWLKFSKEELYIPFLDNCSKGILDLYFVNDLLEDFRKIGFSLVASEEKRDAWDLKTGVVWRYKAEYLETIEDHIDWEILSAFLAQTAAVYRRVRKCEWCGTYFVSSRKDQKYCGDACSSSFRSRTYRKTGKHAEYMGKHTVSGVYIKAADRR